MKTILITTGLCMTLMSSLALAGDKINESLDAAKDGYVDIQHVNGRASIVGWDKNEVRVEGELGERTEEFIFERDGNEILIKVEVRKNRGSWGDWSSGDGDKLEIWVPRNSRVNYTAVNADVKIEQIYGGADVDTVNGEIDAKDLKGRIRLESVNGEIESRELVGDIKIETVNGDINDTSSSNREAYYESVNGDIEVVSDSPEIKAETVNGDIELTLQKVTDLVLTTVNGSIDARLTLQPQGDVRASSVGGSIALYFQKDVSARFDVQGHAGGRISNNLSSDRVQKAKYGPSRWLEFSLNGGEGKVDVSTVSGRVKLDKQ